MLTESLNSRMFSNPETALQEFWWQSITADDRLQQLPQTSFWATHKLLAVVSH
jgi:hypothetical protein